MRSRFFVLLFFMMEFAVHGDVVFNSAEEAAEYALLRNETLQIGKRQAELSCKMARWNIQAFLPDISLSWSDSSSLRLFKADSKTKSLSLSVNQTIFDGGKRRLSYKSALAETQLALKGFCQEEKKFLSEIMSGYYECLLRRKMTGISRELERNALVQLEIIREEFRLGVALENDYLDFLISYKQICNEVAQNEREYRSLLRNFKVSLGLPVEETIVLCDKNPSEADFPEELEGRIPLLWQRFLASSLELEKQKLSVLYARKQLDYARRFFLPDVALQCDVSFSGEALPLTQPDYSFKLVFSFDRLPFFPVGITTGSGRNLGGTDKTARGGASSSVVPDFNYFSSMQSQRLSVAALEVEEKRLPFQLYNGFFQLTAAYDDALKKLRLFRDMHSLVQRKIQISLEAVNSGQKKRIDYLNELSDMAKLEYQIEECICSVMAAANQLEIELDIPLGGLKNVIEKM